MLYNVLWLFMRHAYLLVRWEIVISRLHNEVRELQNNWFNVLLKDTLAGQTLADSVVLDPAHAAAAACRGLDSV